MANDEETEGSPFTRPRFLLAAVFMLALVAMLVWLLVRGGAEGSDADEESSSGETATETSSDTPSAEPEAPSEPASSAPASAETSWCGLEAVASEGTLTRAPADIDWRYIGTTAVPSLPGHGPAVVEDNGFGSCFSRTPEGAVLAAHAYVAAGSDLAVLRATTEHMLVEGEIRDDAIEGDSNEDPRPDRGSSRMSLEGFRLLSYSGEEATVDVLVTTNRGDNYISNVIPLVWQNGDWRVNLQTTDDVTGSLAFVDSPRGFVLWARS